jgi:hypothetical protein
LGEDYRSLSSLCSSLHCPVTSSLLGPNVLLSTLFSNTLSLHFSLNVCDQVSHPYKKKLSPSLKYKFFQIVKITVNLCRVVFTTQKNYMWSDIGTAGVCISLCVLCLWFPRYLDILDSEGREWGKILQLH